MAKKKSRNALEIIRRDVGDDSGFRARVEEETVNARVAREIFGARTAAKLTQQELADLVGTSQPVIARLDTPTSRATPSGCSSASQTRCGCESN
ncbi:MAG TPA: hypothetical protein VKF62_00260 [Planctomycetota bacterium]|nr:hypothetical protein [Planctomycetota bacterium]